MKKIDRIAHKVLDSANIPRDEDYGSIIGILMVISILLTCIRVIQECRKNKDNGLPKSDMCTAYGQDIRLLGKKRTLFTKLRLRKIIKRNLNQDQYQKYGEQLLLSILHLGENITDDETTTLLEAVNV